MADLFKNNSKRQLTEIKQQLDDVIDNSMNPEALAELKQKQLQYVQLTKQKESIEKELEDNIMSFGPMEIKKLSRKEKTQLLIQADECIQLMKKYFDVVKESKEVATNLMKPIGEILGPLQQMSQQINQ
jgi:hypothetical protein